MNSLINMQVQDEIFDVEKVVASFAPAIKESLKSWEESSQFDRLVRSIEEILKERMIRDMEVISENLARLETVCIDDINEDEALKELLMSRDELAFKLHPSVYPLYYDKGYDE